MRDPERDPWPSTDEDDEGVGERSSIGPDEPSPGVKRSGEIDTNAQTSISARDLIRRARAGQFTMNEVRDLLRRRAP